jgi:RNA polymerase sigma-70 factor (ECF subfamily)
VDRGRPPGAEVVSAGAAAGASVDPPDADLIERCLRKDNAAWEQVVLRYRRRVFHIAYKFTGKHDDAEDLTQEIFLKVFKSLDKFNQSADFSTWLGSVARNYCIDHYRASKREREVLVDDLVAFDLAPAVLGQPAPRSEDRDRRSFLLAGLDSLPEKLREAVVLRDLQGLSYNEMAGRLHLPEGTVKSRINRGREELARLLLRAKQPERRRGADGPGDGPTRGGEAMLAVERKGDVEIVRVQDAKLTYPGLSSFFAQVRQLVEAGARKVVVDLQGVTYIDSAAIGCLMDIHRLLQDKDGALRLSGLQPRVETMISMTGVHKIVGIHREEAAALASFGKGRKKGKGDA